MLKKYILFVLILGSFVGNHAFSTTLQPLFPGQYMGWLKGLVEINSGTANLKGQDKVRKKLAPLFKSLGYQVRTVPLANGRGLLVIDMPNANPKIILAGHSDTVFPADSKFKNFTPNGNQLKGPGVIDMKGSVLMMRRVLELLDKTERSQIRIVINDDEETGSSASYAKMQELAANIPNVLIFEPDQIGYVSTSHSGLLWLNVDIKGEEAHAGVDPGAGINACVEAGSKMLEFWKLENLAKKLSVSSDLISGGTAQNTICGQAQIKVDVRFADPSDHDYILSRFQEILDTNYVKNPRKDHGTQNTLTKMVDIDGLTEESTRDLYQEYMNIANTMGISITGHLRGGVDSYRLALPGKKVISGIGAAGENMHNEGEFLDIAKSEEKLAIDVALIKKLLKQ